MGVGRHIDAAGIKADGFPCIVCIICIDRDFQPMSVQRHSMARHYAGADFGAACFSGIPPVKNVAFRAIPGAGRDIVAFG